MARSIGRSSEVSKYRSDCPHQDALEQEWKQLTPASRESRGVAKRARAFEFKAVERKALFLSLLLFLARYEHIPDLYGDCSLLKICWNVDLILHEDLSCLGIKEENQVKTDS